MSKTHNGVIINSFTLKARVAEQQHVYIFPTGPDSSCTLCFQTTTHMTQQFTVGVTVKQILSHVIPLRIFQAASSMCSCHPAAFSDRPLEVSRLCVSSLEHLDSDNG